MKFSDYDFDKFIDDSSNMEMNNIKFDELDINSLVVDENNLMDALSKQGAAIAYFGALAKKSKNNYDDLKRAWEMEWSSYCQSAKNYADKDKLTKNTIKSIEALAISKYSKNINNWQERLNKAKEQADMFEVYYEGWKQKSFVLNNMTQLSIAGLLSPKGTVMNPNNNFPTRNKTAKIIEKIKEKEMQ